MTIEAAVNLITPIRKAIKSRSYIGMFEEAPLSVALGMAIAALEKQEKYAWHDLWKDPEDLPPVGIEVRVVILDTSDGCMAYAQDTYGYHDDSTSPNFLHHIRFRVIKWQYIEPFEEDNE